MGAEGASCFHTLSDEQRDVAKADWDKERFGQICETTDVFTNWKTAIDQLCQKTGACTYDQKKGLEDFYSRVQKAALKAKKAKK